MSPKGITLLGLGPGDPELLTRQAWRILKDCTEIYLRTSLHPVVQGLPQHVEVHSFDYLYDSEDSFEAVYAQIVNRVIVLGARSEGVIYAVPGHPFVVESTGPEIAQRAKLEGIPIKIVEGLSFLEPVFSALCLDPFPNTTMVDGLELAQAHVPPFPPNFPAVIAQIHSRQVASDVKLCLMANYPDVHRVHLVHAAGTPQQLVEEMALYEIDRVDDIGLLTCLFVPPLEPETSFEAFQEVIANLRAPDGCPWDREQTHQSLRSHLLEETYELIAAIDVEDSQAMREELGDLLLQILLHAQIGSEFGEFNMAEILESIHKKIVSRHPHVFGDLELADAGRVVENWERIKELERAENGKEDSSLLDGIAMTLPALVQSEKYQQRAAHVGFDWPDIEGVWDKLNEELKEVDNAGDGVERSAEIGDVLFAIVNLARWFNVDPESALREANLRFRKRFHYIERQARAQGRSVVDLSLEEMEVLWQQAKRENTETS